MVNRIKNHRYSYMPQMIAPIIFSLVDILLKMWLQSLRLHLYKTEVFWVIIFVERRDNSIFLVWLDEMCF